MRSVPRRKWLLVVFLILALVLAACGGGTTAEVSSEVSVEQGQATVEATAPPQEESQPAEAEEASGQAAQQTEAAEETSGEEAAETGQPQTGNQEAAESQEAPFSQAQTFVIVSDESEARFILNEELFGQPKTVVGATNQIQGEIQVVPDNPSASRIGVITIDARTFQTDSGRRDGAIRRFILQSERDEYRYITFTPTEIRGMPESVAVGDTITFQVVGDLKIRDIVQPVTFDVTLEVVSEQELRGSATTQITRDMFDLNIPRVPNVANVSNEVTLEFDFVARPAQ